MKITDRVNGYVARKEGLYYIIQGTAILEKFSNIEPVPENAEVYNRKSLMLPGNRFWITKPDANGICFLVDWLY